MLSSQVLAHLNDEQLEAIYSERDTAVLAGPGSGKTETLTLKLVHLLEDVLPPARGVATLTYSNDAVREFTKRLNLLGYRRGRRLYMGTVHGFCLTEVIRPYAAVADRSGLSSRSVLSRRDQARLLQRLLERHGIDESPARMATTLTRLRRAAACRESLAGFDDRHIPLVSDWDRELAARGALDFEAMTLEALQMIRDIPEVSTLLIARYPWLVVDEYQDLGGPLHQLVQLLRSHGMRVFAVGDPDQCIMNFTGADPRYLRELADEDSVRSIRLRFNYRSGARLIEAAEAPLRESRGYRADPERADVGEIVLLEVEGDIPDQADRIAGEVIPRLTLAGVALHEIAVLYRGKGPVQNAIVDALTRHEIPHVQERDERFPDAEVVRWLQRAARWSLAPWHPDVDLNLDLAAVLRRWRGPDPSEEADLRTRSEVLRFLEATPTASSSAVEWVASADKQLGLLKCLQRTADAPDDASALEALLAMERPPEGPTIIDFAQGAQVEGHVAVTTYHGSKGRQFDVVILPALQRQILPSYFAEGSEAEMLAERRLFYVGLTRARHQVVLCYSPSYLKRPGWRITGRSIFVDEVEERLR